MTWEEVRDLDKSRAVAILPVGALEAHGPHLPLGADIIIAEAMARAAARRLQTRGHAVVLLPSLAYTTAGFAAGFPGTVSLQPATVTDLVSEVARGLTRQGFRLLALANSHLDPDHLNSLRAARARVQEESHLKIVFPDLTQKPWALRLGAEFRSGACHGGQFETSVILAARPELVREATRRTLPPNPISLGRAIRDGSRTFEEAGGPRAYFGHPASASREEGQETTEILGGILEEAVMAELGSLELRDSSVAEATSE